MSDTKNNEPDYVRSVTRKQCIGCGATATTTDRIEHEEYCPEEA